jgi:hypothetical protein
MACDLSYPPPPFLSPGKRGEKGEKAPVFTTFFSFEEKGQEVRPGNKVKIFRIAEFG